MATNPYTGLGGYASKNYNNTIKGLDRYYGQTKKNIESTTDQRVKELNQKKAQASRDAITEGRAANAEYLKSINPYGYNAQKQAGMGLGRSGFAESSKSANFNSMQNRVANVRNTYEQAKINYDNQINEAYNSKNAKMAELAYNTMNNRSKALDSLLSRKIGIASGISSWKLGKGKLDLSRDEFKFRKSQA